MWELYTGAVRGYDRVSTNHADKFMELQESLVSTSAPHNIPDRYRISVVLPERHSQHS